MRILFCVNWEVETLSEENSTKFPPDYRNPGKPYWFFKHLKGDLVVDVIDCRGPGRVDRLERKLTHVLITQGLQAYCRQRNYDLVVSHGAQSGMVLSLLRRLLGNNVPPHVLFDIGCVAGGRSASWIVSTTRYALRPLSMTMCHSSHQLEFYRQYFPEVAESAYFVPLGVDTEEFRPRECIVEDQIICVGYAKRDWNLLVSAYADLKTPTKLILLGIPASMQIHCPGVECVARVDIERMREFISRSRFVVLPLPQRNDCLGQQTFLQAMALGKCVLTSDIPAVRDYVSHDVNGFLYTAGNEKDLQRQLERLLKSPDLTTEMGHRAREHVEVCFSEITMAQRIRGLFEAAVGRSVRRST